MKLDVISIFPEYLAALDLSGDVTPLEVLARSGGQRAGDGIMLLPIPEVAASAVPAAGLPQVIDVTDGPEPRPVASGMSRHAR